MSLWVDKHRPTSLGKLDYHNEQASRLSKLVKSGDFPHLLVYGPSGAGKKTRVMCLLRELYGAGVDKLRIEHQHFETPSKRKIEIVTVASNYHIEVNPSDAGNNDRVVIQELLKTVAQTHQLNADSQRDFKVVIVTEADRLTKDAQHGLRRTMEKYMSTCRIVLVANSSSQVIPAIRSRCLAVRVPAPSHQQITDVLHAVCKKEGLALPSELAQRIAEKSGRNLRRALLMCETCRVQHSPGRRPGTGGVDGGMPMSLRLPRQKVDQEIATPRSLEEGDHLRLGHTRHNATFRLRKLLRNPDQQHEKSEQEFSAASTGSADFELQELQDLLQEQPSSSSRRQDRFRSLWKAQDLENSLKQMLRVAGCSLRILEAVKEEDNERMLALCTGDELTLVEEEVALLSGCLFGRPKLVKKLLKKGVSAGAADTDGRSALHLAAFSGNLETVHCLVKHGANVNAWDAAQSTTPLICAAAVSSPEIVSFLIASGADVNAGLDPSDETALHYAVRANSYACAELLLQAGAKTSGAGARSETPLHVAADYGFDKCLGLLLQHGAKVDLVCGTACKTALHLAAEDGSVGCARLLHDHGARLDLTTNRGQTALHLAAKSQSAELVELLLSWGADINARDSDLRTPLHCCIGKQCRSLDVIKVLVNHGALINEGDTAGYTPLHVAAINQFSSCVELLMDHGGDVTLRNKGGISCLQLIKHRTPSVLANLPDRFSRAILFYERDGVLNNKFAELKINFKPLMSQAKEIFQLAQDPPQYFRNPENLAEWALMLFLVLIGTPVLDYIDTWQKHLGALSVIICWFELMMLVGRLPRLGLYIHMFSKVLRDFFQFLLAYASLVIGFAVAFAVLFPHYPPVGNPLRSFLKVLVMMTGEIEFADMFYPDENDGSILNPTASLVFTAFLFVMTIILMNLLVGLAVSDIQGLQRTAKLGRLVRLTEQMSHIEFTLFSKVMTRLLPEKVFACIAEMALVSPSSYRYTLVLRPNDPNDTRLTRDIMNSACRVAKKHAEKESHKMSGKQRQISSLSYDVDLFQSVVEEQTDGDSDKESAVRDMKLKTLEAKIEVAQSALGTLLLEVRAIAQGLNKLSESHGLPPVRVPRATVVRASRSLDVEARGGRDDAPVNGDAVARGPTIPSTSLDED
ncbi:Replication factor C subunit 3 [Amphibalanus amphitrite]|uniref:Replication factor C subunit 3 n=1 Tax=Amphibalanus amphitrite TaxID=1232801 RepID=A0A6A4VP56_AMPAM|nr:Replication factor C subunit 3 [Amphibalanus amphitrite]